MTVHHLGYAVRDMDRAIGAFTGLGYQIESAPVTDPERRCRICFLTKDGLRVELLSPEREGSDVDGVLKRGGNTPYHICYESEDPKDDLEKISGGGDFLMFLHPKAAPALNGRKVAFLMSPSIGVIEILEKEEGAPWGI